MAARNATPVMLVLIVVVALLIAYHEFFSPRAVSGGTGTGTGSSPATVTVTAVTTTVVERAVPGDQGLGRAVTGLGERVAELERRVGSLEEQLDSLASRLGALEEELAGQKQSSSGSAGSGNLSARLGELEEELARLQAWRLLAEKKLEELEWNLTSLLNTKTFWWKPYLRISSLYYWDAMQSSFREVVGAALRDKAVDKAIAAAGIRQSDPVWLKMWKTVVFLDENYQYHKDTLYVTVYGQLRRDIILLPSMVEENGGGDCEDLALYAYAMLSKTLPDTVKLYLLELPNS